MLDKVSSAQARKVCLTILSWIKKMDDNIEKVNEIWQEKYNNNANHKSQLGIDFQYNKYGSLKRLSAVQLAEVSFGRRQLAVVAACHRLCR